MLLRDHLGWPRTTPRDERAFGRWCRPYVPAWDRRDPSRGAVLTRPSSTDRLCMTACDDCGPTTPIAADWVCGRVCGIFKPPQGTYLFLYCTLSARDVVLSRVTSADRLCVCVTHLRGLANHAVVMGGLSGRAAERKTEDFCEKPARSEEEKDCRFPVGMETGAQRSYATPRGFSNAAASPVGSSPRQAGAWITADCARARLQCPAVVSHTATANP